MAQNTADSTAFSESRSAGESRVAGPGARLAPLVLVPIVFGGVLVNGWVNWDDPLHVLDNPKLSPFSWQGLADLWCAPYRHLFVPASYTVFALEAVAGRVVSGRATPAPVVFHAVSLALHAACAVLVGRLLGRLGARPWAAAAGAALFAVHPLQVESVAWISEQRGLLASLFSLLAIDAVVCRGAELGTRRAWGATACFLTALLCKPTAVVVPILAAAIEAGSGSRRRQSSRTLVALLGGWMVMAAAAALGTKLLQPTAECQTVPWRARPVVAANAVWFYAEKFLLPHGLCIDYGLTPDAVLGSPGAVPRAIAIAVLLAAVGLLPVMMPALKAVRLPSVLFVVPLLPVLGFVPFVFQHISTVADRYAYLAMLGPAAALVAVLESARSRWAWGVAATATLVASVVAFNQVPVWRDSLSLNSHAVGVNGGDSESLNNLGLALLEAGRPGDAVARLQQAVACDPENVRACFNLGLAFHRLGDMASAERQYRHAIALDPRHAKSHNNLGILLAEQKRFPEAEAHFDAALTNDPTLEGVRSNRDRVRALSRDARPE